MFDSIKTIETRNARGLPVEVTNGHCAGNAWVDYEKITQQYDSGDHLALRSRLDLLSGQNRVLLEQEWDGARMTRSINEGGIATRYEYFPQTAVMSATRREAVPAAGGLAAQAEMVSTYSGTFTIGESMQPQWLRQTRTTAAGALSLAGTTEFDEEGRTVSQTGVPST